MKPNVLFVDDEPNILSGLKRGLRSMRESWDMQFAGSGADALKLFDAASIDAIVTDMRMPGMDGAAVLREVRERSPGTIRIVLSGQTDQDVALRVAGISHQFLTKPCEVETIVAKITDALAYRDRLPEGAMQSLVSGLHRLPSSPAIHSELIMELDKPTLSLDKLASLISRDVGLSLKFMQVANAGFFVTNSKVTSPRQAVGLLGVQRTRALILCHCTHWKAEQQGTDLHEALWQHGLDCARLAHAIAVAQELDQTSAELAFSAGLLLDVGASAMLVGDPEKYRMVLAGSDAEDTRRSESEVQHFGATHAAMGAYLAGLWGLPQPVVDAIAHHHDPMPRVDDGFGVLTCVHVAEGLIAAGAAAEPVVDLDYLDQLGVRDCLSVWRDLVAGAKTAESVAAV